MVESRVVTAKPSGKTRPALEVLAQTLGVSDDLAAAGAAVHSVLPDI